MPWWLIALKERFSWRFPAVQTVLVFCVEVLFWKPLSPIWWSIISCLSCWNHWKVLSNKGIVVNSGFIPPGLNGKHMKLTTGTANKATDFQIEESFCSTWHCVHVSQSLDVGYSVVSVSLQQLVQLRQAPAFVTNNLFVLLSFIDHTLQLKENMCKSTKHKQDGVFIQWDECYQLRKHNQMQEHCK